jgi:hypothetical protein
MFILIATVSIFAITGLTWVFNKISSFRICPICAGVFGTWLWIFVGLHFGALEEESWRIIAALFIGGSIVGVAYQLDKQLQAGRSSFAFRLFFIPVGFVAAYGLLVSQWKFFIFPFLFLVVLSFVFLGLSRVGNGKTAEGNAVQILRREKLEKQMKNCC